MFQEFNKTTDSIVGIFYLSKIINGHQMLSTLSKSIFSLNENSRHVNIFFDVHRSSLDVIADVDLESGLPNQLSHLLQSEEVGHRAVLTNVVAVAHLGTAFESDKEIKKTWILRFSRLKK